jgi:ATP-dependent Clp protease ATP-binding subunit ClpA
MDHGTLTDTNGRKVDFRNIIVVMTTNAGAESISRPSVGFTTQDHSSDAMEVIRRSFTPEFRNRLDSIIQFKALDQRTIANVVDKFIIQLEAQLEEKKVSLILDDSAREWLGNRGYDPKMGARPMARVIQEYIKKPLAEDILFGRLAKGGEVHVSVKNDNLILELEEEAVH